MRSVGTGWSRVGVSSTRRAVSRSSLLLLIALLTGCAGLGDAIKPVKPLVKPPASAEEAVAIARKIGQRGRWAEALRYLDSAALSLNDKETLAKARTELTAIWERTRLALEDEILVGDAENLRNKVEVLEKLSLGQPDDLVLTSRRIYWRDVLEDRIEPLTRCAEVHVGDRPALARRCFAVASWLPQSEMIQQRLAAVDDQLRTIESVVAQRKKANRERERQARAKVLLNNAKALIEAHDYRGALDTLATVSKLQPSNSEVAGLQQEAMSLLSPQVKALIKLGDHLYLDEQLEAAVATWQAALTLKPQDEEILARIDRAKTVLNKLETLRRQQRESGLSSPASRADGEAGMKDALLDVRSTVFRYAQPVSCRRNCSVRR